MSNVIFLNHPGKLGEIVAYGERVGRAASHDLRWQAASRAFDELFVEMIRGSSSGVIGSAATRVLEELERLQKLLKTEVL